MSCSSTTRSIRSSAPDRHPPRSMISRATISTMADWASSAGGSSHPVVSGGRPIQVRGRAARHAALGLGVEGRDRARGTTTLSRSTRTAQLSRTATNYLDLDPTYKDAIGRPLVRMTYNYTDNDHKMSVFLTTRRRRSRAPRMPGLFGNPNPRRGISASTSRSVLTSHRRRDHGNRSEDKRNQSLSADLGGEQPIRHGRRRVPAERRPQSDRNDRRADLLVGKSDYFAISEITGPACPSITSAWRNSPIRARRTTAQSGSWGPEREANALDLGRMLPLRNE